MVGLELRHLHRPGKPPGWHSADTKVRPTSFPSFRNPSQVVVFALRKPGPRSAVLSAVPAVRSLSGAARWCTGAEFSRCETFHLCGCSKRCAAIQRHKNRRNPGLLPATPSKPFASSVWSWTGPFPWRSGVRSSSTHRRSNPTGGHQAGRARSVGTAGTANRRRSQTAAICWFSSRTGYGQCAPLRSRSQGPSGCSNPVDLRAVDRGRDAPSPQSPTRRDRTAWRWFPRP